MTCIITPEERALIDAAIAAGRVQRIAQGVTAIDPLQSHSWRAVRDARRKNRAHAPTQRLVRESSKTRMTERRTRLDAEMRALLAEGLTYRQMSERVGLAVSAVHRRCKRLARA